MLPCFCSASKIYGILEIFFFGKKDRFSSQAPQEELRSIAVDPPYRGIGCAEDLFEKLCSSFRANGVEAFKVLVGADLARAHSFYRKLGCYEQKSIRVHRGSSTVVNIKDLKQELY